MELRASVARIRTREPFVIARETKQDVDVIRVALTHDGVSGYGEGSPLSRFGEDAAGGVAWLEAQELPPDPGAFDALLPLAGHQSAKSGLDAALHDLAGKLLGVPVWRMLGLARTGPPTLVTVVLADPDAMARDAERRVRDDGIRRLKLKLGGDGLDVERVRAVRSVTRVLLVADANEAFPDEDAALEVLGPAAELGLDACEQPLPAEALLSSRLRERSPIPIYADESFRGLDDLAACARAVHGVNVKLAKCGGIHEALRIIPAARELGLGVLVGCNLASGLGIAATAQLASLADEVDLDGNLLLERDPWRGVELVDGVQVLADAPGLGVREVP
jgi:L-alanine-DL-glutamate epimerase-like enolase superfamily enzyme